MIPWEDAREDGADRLRRFLAAHGRHRQAVLRQELDRCAGQGREVARRVLPSDGAERAPLYPAQLSGQAARRDDARARARPRRAPGAGQRARAADGADAADAGGDRERVRRDADLPRAAQAGAEPARAQGAARVQGRGHDQHGGAPDRLLQFRARGAHRAARGRAHIRTARRDLARGAAREPRPGHRAQDRTTRRSGATSPISSTRRSTSMPMRSAIAW